MRMVVYVDRHGVMEIVRVGLMVPPRWLVKRNEFYLRQAKQWLK